MSDHHESHGGAYLVVFGMLCIFTVISWVADLIHLPDKRLLAAIVLAVATAKALCVMMYFMHLKFEKAWKYLLLAPTFILAMAIPFALFPDIGGHYYTVDVPQVKEYRLIQAAADEHHGDGHAAEHH